MDSQYLYLPVLSLKNRLKVFKIMKDYLSSSNNHAGMEQILGTANVLLLQIGFFV